MLLAALLVYAPNCHLSLVLASVVQGDAVSCICFHFTKKCRPFFLWGHVLIWFFLGKLREIWASLGIFGQKWCLKRFDLKKYAQHENKCGCFCFFYFLCIIYWAGLWKFGQKSFASPKICLLLHLCSDLLAIFTCYFSGIFFCNLWFLLIVRVNVVFCRVTL